MTTVRQPIRCGSRHQRAAGKVFWAWLVCVANLAFAAGQDGPAHWLHAGAMPPGAIGRQRLLRGGPLSGYCQPVEVRAPNGARIAPAAGTGFGAAYPDSLLVGLQVGAVYRFQISEIPDHPGIEVYPTVELIDRLYPPQGETLKFPVPVELTQDELLMAAEGRFVTRVIYVEDPQLALPIARGKEKPQPWLEVAAGEDPLVAADSLGRPIAILRMGARTPDANGADCTFNYGAEPAMIFDREVPPPQADETLPPMSLHPVPLRR